jgi:hypothetical protein
LFNTVVQGSDSSHCPLPFIVVRVEFAAVPVIYRCSACWLIIVCRLTPSSLSLARRLLRTLSRLAAYFIRLIAVSAQAVCRYQLKLLSPSPGRLIAVQLELCRLLCRFSASPFVAVLSSSLSLFRKSSLPLSNLKTKELVGC